MATPSTPQSSNDIYGSPTSPPKIDRKRKTQSFSNGNIFTYVIPGEILGTESFQSPIRAVVPFNLNNIIYPDTPPLATFARQVVLSEEERRNEEAFKKRQKNKHNNNNRK